MSDLIRECGSCSLCCTVIGVPEIKKGAYEPCAHVCAHGCGIYAARPGSCRRFECQWLMGMLEVDGSVDLDLRPDACGVIFDYHPGTALGDVYRAWEVEPGALGRGKAREVLEGLKENFLVVVTAPGPGGDGGGEGAGGGGAVTHRHLVGPPHRVREATDAMWSWSAGPGGGGAGSGPK